MKKVGIGSLYYGRRIRQSGLVFSTVSDEPRVQQQRIRP
jgi:hypothetical protein